MQKLSANTAGDAFGRAAIAGRLAESKGVFAVVTTESPLSLVGEAEKYAILSKKLDPDFRDGAATRMLGTLYVLAPANLLEGGDSEEGLSLLEGLAAKHPDDPNTELRLAEAYIALGDKDPAGKPLCIAIAKKSALRKDDAKLLERLIHDFGDLHCAAPPPPPPSSAPSATPAPDAPAAD
ncbi:MAG TPA: tetratricopeptide repeat protein [Polyangiaceae bacterium]|nr:tetratricopeptide repeat protein [Polyangiaceae bacterium]